MISFPGRRAMARRVFAIVALLVSASVAAAPPPERTAEQEAAYLQAHNSALERDDAKREDSNRASVEDAADLAIDEVDEDSDNDADSNGTSYNGVGRADPPARTRYEYQRNLRAKAHRLAARRAELAHHHRYVHHRYLRNAGPFHQRNFRRPPEPVDDIADDDSDE
jgi:hypothetical protein